MKEPPAISRLAVVIPALNPDNTLVDLVHRLGDSGFDRFIVVDDGSDAAAEWVFDRIAQNPEVTVLKHAANCGKGRALKTAFNYFLNCCHGYDGVVTVDADGQHDPEDIRSVAERLIRTPDSLILGVRSFGQKVPFRSRLGNLVTRYVFRFMLRKNVSDTQTGLRAMPASFLPEFLRLPGERYEYEADMLISVCRNSGRLTEVPINTIYVDGNRSSHFNPLLDSLRIYFVFFRFGISSALAALIDFAAFMLFYTIVDSIPQAIITGRLCAITVNFFLNKRFVFKSDRRLFYPLATYLALVAFIAFVSYLSIMHLHQRFGIPVFLSKIISELVLFIFSFAVQRNFIFSRREEVVREDGQD